MKVLLTHSEGRLEGLAEALGAGGFSVTHEPLIATEFLPAAESRPAAEKLNGADWLLFTSRTTVQAWANLGLALDSYKIGAVGEGTADEVERLGGTVSLIAEPANAKGFLRVFLALVSPPGRIGFPCGEQALPTLSAGLERAGFTVEKAVLYRTAARPIDRINAELVVLASPSAVAALPQKPENARFIALGPSTYRAIKERGWNAVEAQVPDIEGVVQAVRAAAPVRFTRRVMLQDKTVLTRRPRRLRTTAALRDLVAQTQVRPQDLIAPYFVVSGTNVTEPIGSLPGVARLSPDLLLRDLERGLKLGVRAAMLFGVVPDELKDGSGAHAHDPNGPVVQALRAARRAFGNDIVLMTDVCLCGYTDHGHCGLLHQTPRGVVIDNDPSLEALAKMALLHAEAGADLVSPSDMMDGRVGYLRGALDQAGFQNTGILAYTVKYASAFYGPFRDAAGSVPKGSADEGDPAQNTARPPSDRKTYQMDFRNPREAGLEVALDEAEGADMLMVKPALAYLDILYQMRQASNLPLAAYYVSGEYAALKAAAAAGALEEAAAVHESLTAIKRAGADLIISYHALEAAEKGWLG